MNCLFREIEDMGFEVEVGWKDKDRKKRILTSFRRLKESGDDVKLNCVKKLYRYYNTFNNMAHFQFPLDIPFEKDKYNLEELFHYLEDNVIDSSKRIIVGFIEAIANDEPLNPFCKYLMYPKFYTKDGKRIEDETNQSNNCIPFKVGGLIFESEDDYKLFKNIDKNFNEIVKLVKDGIIDEDFFLKNIKQIRVKESYYDAQKELDGLFKNAARFFYNEDLAHIFLNNDRFYTDYEVADKFFDNINVSMYVC